MYVCLTVSDDVLDHVLDAESGRVSCVLLEYGTVQLYRTRTNAEIKYLRTGWQNLHTLELDEASFSSEMSTVSTNNDSNKIIETNNNIIIICYFFESKK